MTIILTRDGQDMAKLKNDGLLIKDLKESKYPGSMLKTIMLKHGFGAHVLKSHVNQSTLNKLQLQIELQKIPGTTLGNKHIFQIKKKQIQQWIRINAYRGRRLKMGYPARGQRTRTNGKTAKKLNNWKA